MRRLLDAQLLTWQLSALDEVEVVSEVDVIAEHHGRVAAGRVAVELTTSVTVTCARVASPVVVHAQHAVWHGIEQKQAC